MGRDSSSVVTVNMNSSKSKPLSEAKQNQLALARARSLEVRRRNALAKVEGKVNHLRSMLGSDLKPDTVSRIAKEMIAPYPSCEGQGTKGARDPTLDAWRSASSRGSPTSNRQAVDHNARKYALRHGSVEGEDCNRRTRCM